MQLAEVGALLGLDFNVTHHLRMSYLNIEDSATRLEEGQWYTFQGFKYQQLPEAVPAMAPFYSDWEMQFDPGYFVIFTGQHYWIPYLIVTAYAALVFGGKAIMKSWPAFDLQGPLKWWNCALAVFSTMGMLRTVPQLVYNLYTHGFAYTICEPAEVAYGSGATGLWVMLFIFSKIPELFDTAFIVLRKKKLIFLHWYHHITVLLYCWDSYASCAAPGLWFMAMNYTVHALMYTYYTLAAMGYRPWWAPVVTALQISQMAVGIMVCTMIYVLKYAAGDASCAVTDMNFVAGLIMYSSYFVLFGLFALKRYVWPPAPRPPQREGGFPGTLSGGEGWTVQGGVLTCDADAPPAPAAPTPVKAAAPAAEENEEEEEEGEEASPSPKPVRRRSKRKAGRA